MKNRQNTLIIFTNSKAVYSHGEEVVGQGSSAMALELLLCREDGIRAEKMVALGHEKKTMDLKSMDLQIPRS
jgi:hypothetical protein